MAGMSPTVLVWFIKAYFGRTMSSTNSLPGSNSMTLVCSSPILLYLVKSMSLGSITLSTTGNPSIDSCLGLRGLTFCCIITCSSSCSLALLSARESIWSESSAKRPGRGVILGYFSLIEPNILRLNHASWERSSLSCFCNSANCWSFCFSLSRDASSILINDEIDWSTYCFLYI
ncbi:hypothetical protein DSECCO2_651540 [anaerobic digester metagenome]